jgi:ADP-heptose:LPS heptosyltransferase/SAM-dependent methyltransferase
MGMVDILNGKKPILIVGYRAFGDAIFGLPLLEHIRSTYPSSEYHIHADLNLKAEHIFHNHPAIDSISLYEPDNGDPETRWSRAEERWANIHRELHPVHTFNFQNTIERGCIANPEEPEFKWTNAQRAEKYGKTNFVLNHFEKFGITPPASLYSGHLGEMSFSDAEKEWAVEWRSKHRDDFVVILPIAGTTAQKFIPYLEIASHLMIQNHPNAIIYLAGDIVDRSGAWFGERVIPAFNSSFRQLALMTRYADLVIGAETGLLAAAGMWGTPKICFANTSSLYQLVHLTQNDYSIQSTAECSPCYKACYTTDHCPKTIEQLPYCSVMFDYEQVEKNIETIYRANRFRDRFPDFQYRDVKQTIRKWDPFTRPCPLCGQTNSKYFDFWAKCPACGIVYNQWSNMNREIYDGNYISPYQGDNIKRLFLNQARQYFPMVQGSSFLEIGPATTVIMEHAKECGFSVEAIDMAPVSSNGFKFYRGSFEDIDLVGTYDFIWAGHVFEHFQDPRRALKKVFNLLAPGGHAFVSMPDISFINEQEGFDWGHWHRDEHNIMFSMESFRELAESIGFNAIYTQKNPGVTEYVCNNDFHILLRKGGDANATSSRS